MDSSANTTWYNQTLNANPHQSFYLQLAVLIFGYVFTSTGTLVNSFMLVVFVFSKDLYSPEMLHLANISLTDLTFGVEGLVFAYMNQTGTLKSEFSCNCFVFFLYMNSISSILNITMLTINRLVSVLKPLTYQTLLTTKRTLVALSIAWVVSVLHGLTATLTLPTDSWHFNFSDSRCILHSRFSTYHNLYNLLLVTLNTCIMIAAYTYILKTALKHKRRTFMAYYVKGETGTARASMSNASVTQNRQARLTDLRGTKTAGIICFVQVAVWYPYLLIAFLGSLQKDTDNTVKRVNIGFLGPFLGCLVNPLVYTVRNKNIRIACRKMFRVCMIRARFLCPC
ncbi:predicted protein [Nematostella vectensis]|uniref:G-protein coupled receptors family 1 profile domain-containing protein n=1 Tax=Nematostella vectensis TaxID=45351 RepID=A8DUY3_NEMVE|nr:predicted protein [Nematostella vectensis]|eukprot:XP_001619328.1 hypothetical protein NEMVEDRAFT_v1g224293 [Nematostella vectensis]